MKFLRRALLGVFVFFLLLCGFFTAFLFIPLGPAQQSVEIKVEAGEAFSSVVQKLKDSGVIASKTLFSLAATLTARDRKIHWGLYRFDLPVTSWEVLDRMAHGKGVFRRVTIPEGLTMIQIAEVLAQAGIVDKTRFVKQAADPSLLAELALADEGLEGYLFPDTYYFVPFVSERDVIVTMAERFRKAFNTATKQQVEELDLTAHQIVTLASLIEKETAIKHERPLVSAVFHNRLRLNIPLQSDPTVIYGIKNFSGNLTRQDLQSETPYNTYRIRGLPPTPICNPGLSALEAALNPAPVPYLYFVSKNDGSHLFSVSLAEHNQAVRKYQVETQRRPR